MKNKRKPDLHMVKNYLREKIIYDIESPGYNLHNEEKEVVKEFVSSNIGQQFKKLSIKCQKRFYGDTEMEKKREGLEARMWNWIETRYGCREKETLLGDSTAEEALITNAYSEDIVGEKGFLYTPTIGGLPEFRVTESLHDRQITGGNFLLYVESAIDTIKNSSSRSDKDNNRLIQLEEMLAEHKSTPHTLEAIDLMQKDYESARKWWEYMKKNPEPPMVLDKSRGTFDIY